MAQITIIAADAKHVPTAKGGYNVIELTYKKDGKVTARKIMDFTNKAVYAAFKDAQNGDVFDVTEKKNDKDYWEFATATKSTATLPADAPTTATSSRSPASVPKSNYETSEERAARQVMIVRQSSLSNAVALLDVQADKKATADQVIAIAKQFEAYVLGTEVQQSASKAVAAAPKSSPKEVELDDDISDINF